MRRAVRQEALGHKVPNPSSEGVVVVRFRRRWPVHFAVEHYAPLRHRLSVDLRTGGSGVLVYHDHVVGASAMEAVALLGAKPTQQN
jgi:hypothetical protein